MKSASEPKVQKKIFVTAAAVKTLFIEQQGTGNPERRVTEELTPVFEDILSIFVILIISSAH